MKTFNLFFSVLLVSALFMFTSCGDDDKGTPDKQRVKHTYSDTLKGLSGGKFQLSLQPLNLSDIIGTTNASNFTSGELQSAACYVKIEGLSAMTPTPVLKDFTVTANGKNVVLGDCTVNAKTATEFEADEIQSGAKFKEAVQNIFDALVSRSKKAEITVSFNPTEDILTTDKVRIIIYIEADYHYLVY